MKTRTKILNTIAGTFLLSASVLISAVVPSDGLILHFNASNLDDDLSHGDSVAIWENQGSLGGTMGVFGDYTAPVLEKNFAGMQGQSAVKFTRGGGSSTILHFGDFSLPDPDAGITIFTAYTGGDGGAWAMAYVGKRTDSIFGGGFGLESSAITNGPGYRFGQAWGSAMTGADNIPFGPGETGMGTWILEQGGSAATALFRGNGNAIDLETPDPLSTEPVTFIADDNDFVLGGRLTGDGDGVVNAQTYTGYIGEILVYNRVLNLAEIEQVEGYLYDTYVIPEPSVYASLLGLAALVLILLRRRRG